MIPTTYDEAVTLLAKARDRAAGKPVANNTRLFDRGDHIAMRLHNTDIVMYRPDGAIVLDSGGWRTVTTKQRMNEALPGGVYLFQHKREWFIHERGNEQAFYDGLVVSRDGTVVPNREEEANLTVKQERNASTEKAIVKFVQGVTPERVVEAVENMGGDCLLCVMGSTDCLAEHIREDYFHGTLLYRAIEAKGYPNPGLIMQMAYDRAKRGETDPYYVSSTLRRYLRRNLLDDLAVR